MDFLWEQVTLLEQLLLPHNRHSLGCTRLNRNFVDSFPSVTHLGFIIIPNAPATAAFAWRKEGFKGIVESFIGAWMVMSLEGSEFPSRWWWISLSWPGSEGRTLKYNLCVKTIIKIDFAKVLGTRASVLQYDGDEGNGGERWGRRWRGNEKFYHIH